MEIQFVAGEFQQFRVLHKVHLGQFSLDIPEEAVVEFDGMTVKWGGKDYAVPALRGAIRADWLVPVADTTTTTFAPKAAGVQVRPATTTGRDRGEAFSVTAVDEDEQVVGSVQDSKDKTETARKVAAAVATPHRPAAPQSVEASPQVTPEPAPAPGKMQVIDTEDDQGAVTVATIGSPTKSSFVSGDEHEAAEAPRRVESRKGNIKRVPVPSAVNADAEGGTPITETLAGGATGDVAVATEGDTLEELLPNAVSTGTPPATKPPEKAKAKKVPTEVPQVGGEDFNWSKKGHWRDRVQRALVYKDNPEALAAIKAIEIKSVVKQLGVELRKLSR